MLGGLPGRDVLPPQHISLFPLHPSRQYSLVDQGSHVSEPRGPCLELSPELVGMASLSGRDQDEDECSCDHAHDRGHLMGQGAPSEDTGAEVALSLLHQEKGCTQAEPSLGATFLPPLG